MGDRQSSQPSYESLNDELSALVEELLSPMIDRNNPYHRREWVFSWKLTEILRKYCSKPSIHPFLFHFP